MDRSQIFTLLVSKSEALVNEPQVSNNDKNETELNNLRKVFTATNLDLLAVYNNVLHARSNLEIYEEKINDVNILNFVKDMEELEESVSKSVLDISISINAKQEQLKTINVVSKDAHLFLGSVLSSLVSSLTELSEALSKSHVEYMKRIVFARSSLEQIAFTVDRSGTSKIIAEDNPEYKFDTELEGDLRLELELESKSIEMEMEGYLTETRKAEKQVNEISNLLTVFNQRLVEQREVITSIFHDSAQSNNNIESALDQLDKTRKRAKNDIQLFVAYLVASILLLIYDY